MKKQISRRDVLKVLGQAAAATPAAGALNGCVDSGGLEEQPVESTQQALRAADVREPIRGFTPSYLHAYAQKKVVAGQTIDFRISSTVPYQLDIVRLGFSVDRPVHGAPSQDFRIASFAPVTNPVAQQVRPGSYVHVQNGLPATAPLTEMTLECWVKPWQLWPSTGPDKQALISQYTSAAACGFALFISKSEIIIYFGNGGQFDAAHQRKVLRALQRKTWYHVVATFKAGVVSVWVNGVAQAVSAATGAALAAVLPGSAPLRLAAAGESGGTSHLFDGDLAMPVIYSRALTDSEVKTRFADKLPQVPTLGVLACWPFAEETGTTVNDVGPGLRHGQIINNGTWMIGGPGFVAPRDRFTPYDPASDANRGHALRFAADDLYDCGWSITQSYTLPPELPAGVYAGRILYEKPSPDVPAVVPYEVTFVVKRLATKPAAAILVLCATNTWLAYNQPFPRHPEALDGWQTAANANTAIPGSPRYNFYADHSGSTPAYQVGVDIPWAIAAPYVRYGSSGNKYSHLVRAERYLHVWLERNGYDFDVATDFDVHENPALFSRHKTVIVNGHSEYWTAAAYDALQAFVQAGGNLIVTSGNTMFWRVSLDPAGKLIECRKMPSTVGGSASAGELFHSHDGKRGGLLRECERPAWRLTGLESVGYGGIIYGPFTVTDAEHALFRAPEGVAELNGSPLGLAGGPDDGDDGCVGHEYDVRVSQIPNLYDLQVPIDHAPVVLAKFEQNPVSSSEYFDYRGARADRGAASISEIVYDERAGRGSVFSAGSIAIGRGIAADAKLSALLRNVLHRFGSAHRLHLFAIGNNGQLLAKWWDGKAWAQADADWKPLGGAFTGSPDVPDPSQPDDVVRRAPAAVSFGPGMVSVMVVSPAGSLSYKWSANGVWKPSETTFTNLGGVLRGQPRAVSWGRNRFDIFARARSGEIVRKSWNGQTWSPSQTGWQPLGGTGTRAPSAIAWQGNALSISALSHTGSVLYWLQENEALSPMRDLGGAYKLGPVLFTSAGNRINILVVDAGGQLFKAQGDGKTWPTTVEWQSLGGTLQSEPVAVSHAGDQLTIFAVFRDGSLQSRTGNGTTFTDWENLGGRFVGTPAALAFRGSWVVLVASDENGLCVFKWWDTRRKQASEVPWQPFGSGISGDLAGLNWIGTPGV